ncbi:MAG TPA: gluconate 2-dehydrogenase subunit 3 family protein [Candidatus Acidoferrum sp.]|nr:gluconate 2-dehydrogenase subunit 3 family protein [Candidatus Acidoferrum sp.]
MNRRDALRMLTAGAVLPALTPELFAFYQQAHPNGPYSLRSLSPHQNDMVVAMIDQIIPATETPGAKAVRVNEFIDVILTEWANDQERHRFLDGLDDVNKQSNALFGKDFASASPPQQLVLLRSLDAAAEVARSRAKEHPPFWEPEGRDTQMQADFFTVFKNMTLHGYYTSEIGFTQELKLQVIPGSHHGCTVVGPGAGDADA